MVPAGLTPNAWRIDRSSDNSRGIFGVAKNAETILFCQETGYASLAKQDRPFAHHLVEQEVVQGVQPSQRPVVFLLFHTLYTGQTRKML